MANLSDLEAEALKIDPGARARLAERLPTSLEVLSENEIEALWLAEAERRGPELESEAAEELGDGAGVTRAPVHFACRR